MQQLSETLGAFCGALASCFWHSVVFGRRLPFSDTHSNTYFEVTIFAERLARCVTPGEATTFPGWGQVLVPDR